MYETSKSVMRRLHDSRFATRFFVGNGIDIGSGQDPLGNYAEQFPLMNSCREWDLKDGDAQLLASLGDASLDFVHSSHCLEHMCEPREALSNWLRVLKEGGHLIVTVPDEDLYEQGIFPSTWNADHMWTFTMHKTNSWSRKSVNLISLLAEFSADAQIIKIEQLDASFRYNQTRSDQTLNAIAECALEFILRKRTADERARHGQFPDQAPTPEQAIPLPDALKQAMEHLATGRFAEAETIYRAIVAADSSDPEAFKNYGNTLLFLGRNAEAEQAYRKALALKPNYGEAYNNLGIVLLRQERYDEAETAVRKALSLMPDRAEIHNSFGNVLLESGRIEEAEQAYRTSVNLKPDYHIAHANHGFTLRVLGQREEALSSYQQAIDLKPDYAEAYAGLGQTLNHLGQLEEAEQAYRRAITIKPDCAEAYCGLANVLVDTGQDEQAEMLYRKSLAIKPDYASAKCSLSLLNLMAGRYEEGFVEFESRFNGGNVASFRNIKTLFQQLLHKNRWDGSSLRNRSLLVLCEQGVGDSLMMLRYLPLLEQLETVRILVYCHPQLRRLFDTQSSRIKSIPWTEPIPIDEVDAYCPIMSLPYCFRTTLQTVPANVPYLVVPEPMKSIWRDRLKQHDGLKAGLVWAGNPQFIMDQYRSIPFKEFEPLFRVNEVHFVSLQKECSPVLLKNRDREISDWMAECGDFLDTAALVSELDLVISVDTAVAHLAGALGKRVWLLNRSSSEWRWMRHREDSPWYPTMRIFRQEQRGDWQPVIRRIAEELSSISAEQGGAGSSLTH